MRALWILVATAWRKHWRASLFLGVVAGLAAGLVGASFQAAGRAHTTLDRFAQRSRRFDFVVQGCPPGTDPETLHGVADTIEQCSNLPHTAEFQQVLDGLPGVERTAITTLLVVGLVDESMANGWGRMTLLSGIATPGTHSLAARPIVVDGRLPHPNAAGEVVISEDAARVTGLHSGAVVRMAGWRQSQLDAAVDGTVAPETPVVRSKIVGVVRFPDDVQRSGAGWLSEGIPGDFNVFAGPAWMAAHAERFPGYGSAVLVRLRGGSASAKAFQDRLNEPPGGWFNQASPVSDVEYGSLQRVIDLERNALLVTAGIAIVAAAVFTGLTTARQLRRESAESGLLFALGMTRRELHAVNVVRALTIAAGAAVVAAATIVALSPLAPIGLARKLEFHLGAHFDPLVVTYTVIAVIVVFAVVGLVTPVSERDDRAAAARARPSRGDRIWPTIGPVATVSGTMARGRLSRGAIAVTAVAVAAGIAAGTLIASYDHLVDEPRRYGAWWDLAVGQYSEPEALGVGVAKVRANPAVIAASGYLEQADIVRVDRMSVRLLALESYVGHRGPVMASGRAPANGGEVALGRTTARRLHKTIGDRVTVVSTDDTRMRLRVVGITVVNDPVSLQASPGAGVFVQPSVFGALLGRSPLAQSIVIRVDPHRDRAAAIESVRRDFAGSIREAGPQVGTSDLGRLRAVPWLIAGLVAILALASLVHALATILNQNRKTLAVLAVLGFVRRQRRAVGVLASLLLVLLGVAIGIPVGLFVGSAVWRAVSDGIDLPSHAALAWPVTAAETIGAAAVAVVIALVASRGPSRAAPRDELRVE